MAYDDPEWGRVTCACGAVAMRPYFAGEPNPAHHKTWCGTCGVELEGEVRHEPDTTPDEPPPNPPQGHVRYVPMGSLVSVVPLRQHVEELLGRPPPYSVSELAETFERLALPYLAPGWELLSVEELEAGKETLLALTYVVATLFVGRDGPPEEQDRARARRWVQEAVLQVLRQRIEVHRAG